MINLGDKVRDTVSGWEGIATGRYEYLNGCRRWQVDGVDKEGKPEGFVFDEQQLEVSETQAVVPKDHSPREQLTGGPRGNRPLPR